MGKRRGGERDMSVGARVGMSGSGGSQSATRSQLRGACGIYAARLTCLFFFQAEDGIRDSEVTGVQTCALPISSRRGIRDSEVTGVQTCALPIDRKSTRLNSSQLRISYAVFCLDRKS